MKALTRSMKFGLLILTSTQAPARAGDDPVDILKKVDAAAKAVQAVYYETEFKGIGESAAQIPEIKAKIKIGGITGGRPTLVHAELWAKMPESEETKHVVVGTDGDDYYVIDHKSKKVYVDIDPAVMGGAGRYFQMAAVGEFGHPTPFSDEINGKKQELLGDCEVSGVPGYEIHVVYANDVQEATWCFSKKTHLPRMRIDKFKVRTGGERMQKRVISKLQLLESVDKSAFKLEIPEGYERIDDFYPN